MEAPEMEKGNGSLNLKLNPHHISPESNNKMLGGLGVSKHDPKELHGFHIISSNEEEEEEEEEDMMMVIKESEEELGVGEEEEDGAMEEGRSLEQEAGGLAPAARVTKCILNLPWAWNAELFKKFLVEKEISFVSVKKKKGMCIGFITFGAAEYALHANKQLEGLWVNKRQLKVEDVQPRSWEKRRESFRKVQNESNESRQVMTTKEKASGSASTGVTLESAVTKCAEDLVKCRDICDAVTPLAQMPYEEQLILKKNGIAQILKKLTRNTRKCCADDVILPDWLISAKDRAGLCCEFEGIVASTLVDGYRNKCEFTVGFSPDGEPIVGFQLGMFREGITAVAEPSLCRNVSAISKTYAAAFQDFVRKSELPIWNKHLNTGFWRMLTVREGRAATVKDSELVSSISEVMLIIQVCPSGVSDDRSTMEYQEAAKFLSTFASASCPQLPLTTILIQEHVGVSNAASPDAKILPVYGSFSDGDCGSNDPAGHIHDHVNGLKFRISPTAFFQVNTLAAEKLYSLAGEWAGLGPDTLLFDVCCGTGTIGLTLARHVGMVVGIEMNDSAVSDAWVNAKINEISNCRFVCAKAEDVIMSLLDEYLVPLAKTSAMTNQSNQEMSDSKPDTRQFTNVVVIVDPPRCGLHPVVVKTLRIHTQLQRVVYISCNPESLLANAVELCTPLCTASKEKQDWKGPNRQKGGGSNLNQARQHLKRMPLSEPFKPMKAIAVDLFPHTQHCEMVLLLER